MSKDSLAEVLNQRRVNLNVTQEYLSELSGVGLRTIKKIEKGQGNPTIATISKLADVLGLEVKLEIKKIS